MNLNESYDGKTRLKDWWIIVKSNFSVIKENIEAIMSDILGIRQNIGDMDLIVEPNLTHSISNIAQKNLLLSMDFTELENNLNDNYYTKTDIDTQIGTINTALENALNGGAS